MVPIIRMLLGDCSQDQGRRLVNMMRPHVPEESIVFYTTTLTTIHDKNRTASFDTTDGHAVAVYFDGFDFGEDKAKVDDAVDVLMNAIWDHVSSLPGCNVQLVEAA